MGAVFAAGVKKTVIAVVQVVGFHAWPNAPREVRYLSHPHRHVFTFRVEFDVTEDRQVEFHLAQRSVRETIDLLWDGGEVREYDFGERSCETIASEVGERMRVPGGYRPSAVEVWEDSENGARVEWS